MMEELLRADIGAVILCRYDSSRLPGKILCKIGGKYVLEYIHERVGTLLPSDRIIVATSEEASDDVIEDFCVRRKWNYFRGSKDDVSSRVLHCAKKYGFGYLIRICGDNVFIDPALIKKGAKLLDERDYDLISNLDGRTFPYGQSVEIVKTEFFKNYYKHFDKQEYKEHVTKYFYEHAECGDFQFFYNDICPEAKGLRLVLDTQTDYELLNSIALLMDKPHVEYGLKELYYLSTVASEDKV